MFWRFHFKVPTRLTLPKTNISHLKHWCLEDIFLLKKQQKIRSKGIFLFSLWLALWKSVQAPGISRWIHQIPPATPRRRNSRRTWEVKSCAGREFFLPTKLEFGKKWFSFSKRWSSGSSCMFFRLCETGKTGTRMETASSFVLQHQR